jgi:pimeloyl-ACP methyl ester carboxylesterase
MTSVTEHDVEVAGGRLRVRDHGGQGRLVLCVPGLSANAASFDMLGERLATHAQHVVSLDLRGRGFSEVTAAGTYGWPAHARDVLDVVAQLGGGPADIIGHSMGAYVVMAAAGIDGGSVRRIVLIDGLGPPEQAALPPILAGLQRLGTVYASADDYLERIRAIGVVDLQNRYWDRYYRYDLEPVDGGVRSRTNASAVMEDVRWGLDHDQRDLWAAITQPTLLVCAQRPIGAGGFIVSADDRAAFLRLAPNARAVDVDANHYTVVADEQTARCVDEFLADG